MKTLNIKKAVALTALTLAPALGMTSAVQAAPSYHAPVAKRTNPVPAWNNNSHGNAPRFDARSNQPQRFEPRYQNNRNDGRFENRRSDARFDPRRDNEKNRNKGGGNDTAKIIGAGVVGAILGAVLSH